MTVFSSDGEKLGKVAATGARTFTVEKGIFFPKDYLARYDEIAEITGDEIRLALTKDAFVAMRESGSYGVSGAEDTERTSAGDIRVPVHEEELDVVKRERDAGEVRLRKDVVTETRHVDVPVTREVVHVERTPATGERAMSAGERAFEKDSVSVPVHEEEVEIRKRPVVKEEVRLRKERVTEHRAADEDLRKERVDVEGEGGARPLRGDEPGPFPPRRDDDELP
ncbi:YsnF/AvaK domain-containing protein [Anaeromyxobacter dehalogenans]|nr:YsnF/AvaK domain-containing protein [Anaeromyxobacter dehalogenans]